MATTVAAGSSVVRTSTLVPGSGMVLGSFLVAAGTRRRHERLVVLERHEVREAGYPEDLPVVLGQSPGPDFAVVPAGLRQEAHDQGDARAVDVVDRAEVELDDRSA